MATATTVKHAIIAGIPLLWAAPTVPSNKLVIWLPGFSGSKEGVQENLLDLAQAGFWGLSFDPVQHGERLIASLDELRTRVRGNIRRYFWPILAQTAEETSTVIDWAQHEFGVSRVGMGGISMGGDIAVAAAGADARIGAVAACIATADWLRPGSFEPPGEPDGVAQSAYDRRNPLTHVADYHTCPAITFQCGAQDQQVPPDGAQRFVDLLRSTLYTEQPDRLAVFLQPDTAHKFTSLMWTNACNWFRKYM